MRQNGQLSFRCHLDYLRLYTHGQNKVTLRNHNRIRLEQSVMINGVRWVRVRGWRGQMGLGLELHTFRRDRDNTDNNFKEKKNAG